MREADKIIFPLNPDLETLMTSLDDDGVHDDNNSDLEADLNDNESVRVQENFEDDTSNGKVYAKMSQQQRTYDRPAADSDKDSTTEKENVDQHKDNNRIDEEIENNFVNKPDAISTSVNLEKSVCVCMPMNILVLALKMNLSVKNMT